MNNQNAFCLIFSYLNEVTRDAYMLVIKKLPRVALLLESTIEILNGELSGYVRKLITEKFQILLKCHASNAGSLVV